MLIPIILVHVGRLVGRLRSWRSDRKKKERKKGKRKNRNFFKNRKSANECLGSSSSIVIVYVVCVCACVCFLENGVMATAGPIFSYFRLALLLLFLYELFLYHYCCCCQAVRTAGRLAYASCLLPHPSTRRSPQITREVKPEQAREIHKRDFTSFSAAMADPAQNKHSIFIRVFHHRSGKPRKT